MRAPFGDLAPWLAGVVEETRPDLVVSIARGATRLLQIHGSGLPAGIRVLSHHAIPFIKASELINARVLIVDDAVIFGSTMARARDYLLKRGAMVFCATYAVDRTHFFGERQPRSGSIAEPSEHAWMPLRASRRLWPNAMRRHHAMLVRSVLRTSLNYYPDFPTFVIRSKPYPQQDIPFIAQFLRGAKGVRGLFDVSSPAGAAGSVFRYTAFFERTAWNLVSHPSVTCRPYSKARLTFVPDAGEIRVTPLAQFSIGTELRYEELKFSEPILQEFWRSLRPPEEENDPFYSQSLLRLLTSFASVVIGAELRRRIMDALPAELLPCTAELETNDVTAVLGEENTESIAKMWAGLEALEEIPGLTATQQGVQQSEEPNAPGLRQSMIDICKRVPQLKPGKHELPWESVGKLFLSLRQATDTTQKRITNPSADRLDVGLSYSAVQALLENFDIRLLPDEIGLALDMCVDNGLAVPKVIIEDGKCFRAFYCGENEDDQPSEQFKRAIFYAYGKYLKLDGAKHLTPFDLQKLCVSLKGIASWLPVSTGPYKFGWVAAMGAKSLIPALTEQDVGPLNIIRSPHQVLVPNPHFVSSVRETWSLAESREFYDGFEFLATAFSRVSDGAKLLLSTCRDHTYTYNAIAFEAHAWAGYNSPDTFGYLIKLLQKSLTTNAPAGRPALMALYWSIRYVAEAIKKHDVFYNLFGSLFNELNSEFERQGSAASRWWTFAARGLLVDSKDPEIEERFSLLIPLLHQITRLTVFLVKILNNAGIVNNAVLESEFRNNHASLEFKEFDWMRAIDAGTAAAQYNDHISKGAIPGISLFRTLLPMEGSLFSDAKPFGQVLQTISTCFDEVHRALHEFCKRYQVVENDFPYSPTTNRRTLEDGTIERRLENVFMLALDVVKSTNSGVTNKCIDAVRATFLRFQGIHVEETGNDRFLACADDPALLWDCAMSIAHECWQMRQHGERFAGTRKAIGVGTLAIMQKPNGTVMIRDVQQPNLIPVVVCLMEAADQAASSDHTRNFAVAFSKEAFRLCAQRLNLDLASTLEVTLKSKHFRGACNVVRLPSAE